MTIFFYKGLTGNLEIRNTPVWVLPNIWRLGWVRDTKSGTNVSKARFTLGNKWRYLAIIFRWYSTITLKTSVIRFTYIKSEFWNSFHIMSDSERKDILFLQLVVLFKMKKKKRRKRKNGYENYFVSKKKKEHSTT